MTHTLQSVRDSVRNRDGKRVYFLPKGDRLTSEARDYLTEQRIEIREGTGDFTAYTRIDGGILTEKPENLTHLRGDVLVPKTHPRIVLRGMIDALEADILLAQKRAKSPFDKELGEILSFARKILRCEVMEESMGDEKVLGLTDGEQRLRSHHPQEYYGQGHFMPSAEDSEMLLYVNRARCTARQAELAAQKAFTDMDGNLTRPDLIRAMNRMSSLLYIIMIRMKAEEKG